MSEPGNALGSGEQIDTGGDDTKGHTRPSDKKPFLQGDMNQQEEEVTIKQSDVNKTGEEGDSIGRDERYGDGGERGQEDSEGDGKDGEDGEDDDEDEEPLVLLTPLTVAGGMPHLQ